MSGFVLGFKGSNIYSLVGTTIHTVDVPQSATVLKLI